MRALVFPVLVSIAMSFAACSEESATSPSQSGSDAGGDSPIGDRRDSGSEEPISDAGSDAEEPLTEQTEQEPNNGATATELGSMTLPGIMNGSIDPARDVDIFAITPAAGEFWEWTLSPKTTALAPHLTIFDTAPSNTNPTVLAKEVAGEPVVLQHFVLGAGKFVATVRDARNVAADGGVGGSAFGYSLSGKKKTIAPVTMTVPSTKTGKLASLSSVDLYTFTLGASTGVDVIIRADRKASPSTLDSRLSLFNPTTKKSLGTNDDADGTTSDSQLGGTLPAGTYLIVVENEGVDGTDLSYEIELAPR